MDAGKKKTFTVKARSLTRTLKQYNNYKAEVSAYDMNAVSQDKKKQEFYAQSKSALDHVAKNLVEYCLALNAFIVHVYSIQEQNKEEIEEDNSVLQDYEKAKLSIMEVKSLFPAEC